MYSLTAQIIFLLVNFEHENFLRYFMIFNIYSAYIHFKYGNIRNSRVLSPFFFFSFDCETLWFSVVCLRFGTFIYLCASKIFMALFISLYLLGFIALRAIVLREMFISVNILLIVFVYIFFFFLALRPCNAQFCFKYFIFF